jgi:hypothetical protein
MKRYPDPSKLALADLREEVARQKLFLTELCEALSCVVAKAENEFGIEAEASSGEVARLKSLLLQAGDHEADLCQALEALLEFPHAKREQARAALAKARGEQS